MRGRLNILIKEGDEKGKRALDKVYTIPKSVRGKIVLAAIDRYFSTPEGEGMLRIHAKPLVDPPSADKDKKSSPKITTETDPLKKVMGDF